MRELEASMSPSMVADLFMDTSTNVHALLGSTLDSHPQFELSGDLLVKLFNVQILAHYYYGTEYLIEQNR